MKKVLTIAGSDSGGGAGIQADLKTFQALGAYGGSVVTAVTAQDTRGVRAVHVVPEDVVAMQLDAVLDDIAWGAVKTGMLATAGVVRVVADRLRQRLDLPLVVDPVMVSKSGHALLDPAAREVLVRELLPLALVATPNALEASALAGFPVRTGADARRAARVLFGMGARHVVVKGGHLSGRAGGGKAAGRTGDECVDLLYDGQHFYEFRGRRHRTKNLHGTGCTFASAIAAGLARGRTVREAVGLARAFLDAAIARADLLGVGHGHGPVDHQAGGRSRRVRAILRGDS